MGESFEEKVRNWLHSQGYPLEMIVARALQEHGFRVIQGEYYRDPESDKFREIDLTATLADIVEGTFARVDYIVECKQSRDKPWILFTSLGVRISSVASVAQRAASELGQRYLSKLAQRKDVQALPVFSVPRSRQGYGLTQAFTSGQDIAYAAASSVSAAALAQTIAADNRPAGPACALAFPVIVIDGKLFESYLDDESNMVVSEIESGILLWRNPVVGMPYTIIQVVTTPALDEFADGANRSAHFLLESCKEELLEAAKEDPERGVGVTWA